MVTWNVPPSNGTSAVTSYNVQYRLAVVPPTTPGTAPTAHPPKSAWATLPLPYC